MKNFKSILLALSLAMVANSNVFAVMTPAQMQAATKQELAQELRNLGWNLSDADVNGTTEDYLIAALTQEQEEQEEAAADQDEQTRLAGLQLVVADQAEQARLAGLQLVVADQAEQVRPTFLGRVRKAATGQTAINVGKVFVAYASGAVTFFAGGATAPALLVAGTVGAASSETVRNSVKRVASAAFDSVAAKFSRNAEPDSEEMLKLIEFK